MGENFTFFFLSTRKQLGEHREEKKQKKREENIARYSTTMATLKLGRYPDTYVIYYDHPLPHRTIIQIKGG